MYGFSSSLRSQGAGELYPEDIESQTLNVYGILYAVMCVNSYWNVHDGPGKECLGIVGQTNYSLDDLRENPNFQEPMASCAS